MLIGFIKAALFSAIDSAFLIASLPQLQPPSQSDTNAILSRIADKLDPSVLVQPEAPFRATKIAIIYNCLFALSLALSLLAVVGAVLAKEWLGHYLAKGPVSYERQSRERQLKWMGATKWRLDLVVVSLPLILQAAVFWFIVGLVMFLWETSKAVAVTVLVIAAVGVAAFVFTVFVAAADPHCPFQSPLASFVRYTAKMAKHAVPGPFVDFFRRKPSSITPDNVAAASVTWVLENSANPGALLGAAQNLPSLCIGGVHPFLPDGREFSRLLELLQQSLKIIDKAYLLGGGKLSPLIDGHTGAALQAAVIYARAVFVVILSSPDRVQTMERLRQRLEANWWGPSMSASGLEAVLSWSQELTFFRACVNGDSKPRRTFRWEVKTHNTALPLYALGCAQFCDRKTKSFRTRAVELSYPAKDFMGVGQWASQRNMSLVGWSLSQAVGATAVKIEEEAFWQAGWMSYVRVE